MIPTRSALPLALAAVAAVWLAGRSAPQVRGQAPKPTPATVLPNTTASNSARIDTLEVTLRDLAQRVDRLADAVERTRLPLTPASSVPPGSAAPAAPAAPAELAPGSSSSRGKVRWGRCSGRVFE